MAQRKDDPGLFEMLLEIAALLPWWIDLPLAAGSYVGLSALARNLSEKVATSKTNQLLSTSLFAGLAQAGKWIVPLVFVLGSITSLIHRLHERKIQPTAPPKPDDPNIAAAARPLCPRCSSPMEQRTAKKGPTAGTRFWGCPSFPSCRGTREIT